MDGIDSDGDRRSPIVPVRILESDSLGIHVDDGIPSSGIGRGMAEGALDRGVDTEFSEIKGTTGDQPGETSAVAVD